MKRHRANSSYSTAQAGRPSAGGRRVPAALERVLRDGRWSLGHRESQSGACASRSLPAAPGLCSGAVSVLSLARLQAFQGANLEALALFSAVRERTACVGRPPRSAPASGSCLRGLGGIEGRAEERLPVFLPSLCGKQLVPRAVWRGKLALMVRNEALLHQPPNRFIERTPSSWLRQLPVAAHVERWTS